MIDFERGSGRYEQASRVVRFGASDEFGPVRCAITLDALGGLMRSPIDPIDPMALFQRSERIVFNLAREVYRLRGRNDRGGLSISVFDVTVARRRRP